jgi:hypothetical protein
MCWFPCFLHRRRFADRHMGDMYKVVTWYDNEWGYSNRLADMAAFVAGTTVKWLVDALATSH